MHSLWGKLQFKVPVNLVIGRVFNLGFIIIISGLKRNPVCFFFNKKGKMILIHVH